MNKVSEALRVGTSVNVGIGEESFATVLVGQQRGDVLIWKVGGAHV